VETYRVRCDLHPKICAEQATAAASTEIRLYTPSGFEVYTGERTMPAGRLLDWIRDGIESKVVAVTPETYSEYVYKGTPWMILYGAPWSNLVRHAERRFRYASQLKIEHKGFRYHQFDADDSQPPPVLAAADTRFVKSRARGPAATLFNCTQRSFLNRL
jgi:hypothetical protein